MPDPVTPIELPSVIDFYKEDLFSTPKAEISRLSPDRGPWLANQLQSLLNNDAFKDLDLTDQGCAERFLALHGDFIRFCPEWKNQGWLAWDETRWIRDEMGLEVERLATDVPRILSFEAVHSDIGSKFTKAALEYQSAWKVKQVLLAARREVVTHPEELDTDPFLLNLRNGTLNLKTGQLRDAWKSDYITKLAPVWQEPLAEAPLWRQFISQSMGGDQILADFLQRAVGYSLTGDVSEQKMFFLFGSGANGKSTFLNTILDLLGDYGHQAANNLLVHRRGKNDEAAIAGLFGRRFVSSIEVEDGAHLAEVLVKTMTGGDKLRGRNLYENPFEFHPQHKLWLAANKKPEVKGRDHAIWRRILTIPFEVEVPEDERDPHLKEKLLKEGPGILNWAIEGSLAWQEQGLAPPTKVIQATEAYREETDILGEFLEGYETDPESHVPTNEVRQDFLEWAEEMGEKKVGGRKLISMLEERGWKRGRRGNRATWEGVRRVSR